MGIPAEYLPHVFDRFFRVPGQSDEGGTGLGLAIVKEIVAAHGGEITCESEPGKGTTFRVTLPAWAGAEADHMNRPTRAQPAEQFLSLIREQQRGRLKVYLGFAPGVGKTYEMLQEGHRLKKQGVDVVVGVVETHGRAETAALVGDLEQVPRRTIEYRGRGAGGDGPRRGPRPPADRRAGGRTGPHQRPRQPARQALPGRRGAAPGRHPRHHAR